MGLSLVRSRALLGLDARPVQVEVHLANGLPSFTNVSSQQDSDKRLPSEGCERIARCLHPDVDGGPRSPGKRTHPSSFKWYLSVGRRNAST